MKECSDWIKIKIVFKYNKTNEAVWLTQKMIAGLFCTVGSNEILMDKVMKVK